jgi:hypothetical protein
MNEEPFASMMIEDVACGNVQIIFSLYTGVDLNYKICGGPRPVRNYLIGRFGEKAYEGVDLKQSELDEVLKDCNLKWNYQLFLQSILKGAGVINANRSA